MKHLTAYIYESLSLVDFIKYKVVKCDETIANIILSTHNESNMSQKIMSEIESLLSSNKIKSFFLIKRFINKKITPVENVYGYLLDMTEPDNTNKDLYIIIDSIPIKFKDADIQKSFNLSDSYAYIIKDENDKNVMNIDDKYLLNKKYINSSDFLFKESRLPNLISVKDHHNKEIHPIFEIYDEDTLNEYISNKQLNKTYWENKSLYMGKEKNKSTWVVNTSISYNLNENDINDFLTSSRMIYSKEDLLYLLKEEKNILIII